MQKNLFRTKLLLALSISTLVLPALADEVMGTSLPSVAPKVEASSNHRATACAPWKSAVAMDVKSLDKLEKNLPKDNGTTYSQDKLVVILGRDHATAKKIFTNEKKKMVQTKEGRVDLKGAILNGFDLSDLNLDDVDLKGAELNGANLAGASLRNANLYKTEFEGANLNNADMTFAYVSKANFINASLCETTLASTDLEYADILGAYMKGAKLDAAKNIPKVLYMNMNADNVLNNGMTVPPEKF